MKKPTKVRHGVLSALVARNVVRIRSAKGVTQTALAERTGITQPTVSKVETGSYPPPLELIETLAAGLGVPPLKLFEENLP